MSPNREAERLRIIIEALAFTNPEMNMGEAADVIFKIEKQSHEHESRENPFSGIELRDNNPETLACFIDLVPEIQAYLPHRKINAIKELRLRVSDSTVPGAGIGLVHAKDGVEHWVATRTPTVGLPAPMAPHPSMGTGVSSSSAPASSRPADVADWIDGSSVVLTTITDCLAGKIKYGKIQAIKDVRAEGSLGLKEAKEGVEEWLRTRHPGVTWPT